MSQDLIKALERAAKALSAVGAHVPADEAREALSRHRSSVESVELPEGEAVAWRDDGQQAANGPLHLCYRVVTSETLAGMPRAAAEAYTEALYTASTVRSLIAAAVERERELCAKVCEGIEDEYQRAEGRRYPELKSDAQTGAGVCAAAIRARGEK